jgi:hypothetical protein
MELRQSTEVKVRIGPFVDVTNGYEPETGITLGAADEAELLKQNGLATVDISSATWSAVASCDGWYDLTLTTAYTDTLGHLTVVVQDDSVCLPVFVHFEVVTSNYYDSKYSTDKLEVDLTYIHGSALTETAGQLAAGFKKVFDVATPVFTSESVNQSANNNTILAHADYGNAKLVRSTTPANALDVSATGEAGLDFANIKDATGAHTLTHITVPTVTALTGKTGFSLLSTGANLILKDSTFALAIADAIWDEILTGATHNITNSAGLRVRQIGAYAIHDGTAQAGNATCITLAATASAIDGTYNRNLLVITDNTGVGQTRTIIDYDGSTKIATIDREWRTNPDATSVYQIVADDTPLVVDQGVAQAGSTSSTIKLRAYASSINDTYLCNIVIIVAGTGRGQARLVGAYDGTSKVVTLCGDDWVTTPDDTSVYVMIPYGATCTSCIGDDALAQINTEMDNVLDTAIPGSPAANSINQRIKAIDELTEGSGSGDLAAILADTGELQTDWVNGGRLDLLLDACALEATVAALNNISVADIIAGIADGSYDLQEMMRIIFSACCLKSAGGGTPTITMRDSGDAKDRISATVDAAGNRTAITLDGS